MAKSISELRRTPTRQTSMETNMTTTGPLAYLGFSMTPPQREAAEALEGKFAVVGGPGSGKTRVLIGRMLSLLHRAELPASITCLTASSGNAHEIRRQLDALTDSRGIEVCTIQEHARRFLREVRGAASAAGLSPGYTCLDEQQASKVIKELVWSNPGMAMLHTREMHEFFHWHRLNLARHTDAPLPPESAGWFLLRDQYTGEKRRQNLVDPDDMIPLSIAAMERHPDGFSLWNRIRHRHLLVDEYEEITMAQYRLLQLMSSGSLSVIVSAYYNGRIGLNPGARSDLLELFYLDNRDARFFPLGLNHRSRAGLVKMAEAMTGHPDMSGLAAITQAVIRPEGPRAQALVYRCSQRRMDQEIVAMLERCYDEGHVWEDMALVSRRPSSIKRYITRLTNRGIPHTVLGNGRRPRSIQARIIIAMLTCLVNPWDEAAFRLAASDRDTWKPLQQELERSIAWLARTEGIGLIEAAGRYLPEIRDARTRRDLHRALELYHSLSGMIDASNPRVYDICRQVQYLLHPNARFGLPPPQEAETTKLIHLSGVVATYSGEDLRESIARLLDLITFPPFLDRRIDDSEAPGGDTKGVTLSTIDVAKGLQWKYLWFIDANDHVIPGRASEYGGMATPTLEEEQRRFYLASTRATDFLYYCSIDNSEWGHSARPTRFLSAIAEHIDQEMVEDDGPVQVMSSGSLG